MATSAPLWAETSVRWLRSNNPEYVAASSVMPAANQLSSALYRMSYRQFELVATDGMSMSEYKRVIKDATSTWTEADHADMVKFIKEGGHSALVLAADIEKLESEVVAAAKAEPMIVDVRDGAGKIVGREITSIIMDEAELDREIESELKKLTPVSQPSPEHELDEIVADAALKGDTRFGAW